MDHQMFRFVLLLFCALGISCQDPEVEIPQGRLRGGIRTNIDGGTYYSFQSIPFGKPPVGELRYKAPEPAEGWEGTRDATEDLPSCVQIPRGPSSVISGQEDCLYLDVYTPELPGESTSKKAVMVWIHGGAFIMGGGQENNFGAEFLLSKDVVLVTFNYRLGMFGFLSIDDPELGVPGNAGSRDQVLALQWVQDNIEYFGGDPDNVLIFGQSAGGMSTHLQVLSPLSKGLFHKAIIQSGTGNNKDFIDYRVRNTGVLLAESAGIQTENWAEMLESLRSAPVEDLVAAETPLISSISFFSSPIVERASSEPFFPEQPIDMIRSGDYNHVPLMIGFCDAEGMTAASQALQSGSSSFPITDFVAFIPDDLEIEAGSETEAAVAERIKVFYYGDAEVTDNITSGIELNTDYDSGFPSYRSTLEHLNSGENPIYFYFFTADTALNPSKQGKDITYAGAAHEDELAYLFHSSSTPEYEAGSVEDVAIRTMVNLWTNFAIYSNPTPDGFDDYKWQPVQSDEFHYLHIDTEETTPEDDNPKPANFQFWSELYAEYFPGGVL